MTLIAIHRTNREAVILTDCRITGCGMGTKRDVCLKSFRVNGWSTVAFTGDVCFGAHLTRSILARLMNESGRANPKWLVNDDRLKRVIARAASAHPITTPHQKCATAGASIIIVWMRDTMIRRIDASGTSYPLEPRVEVLVVSARKATATSDLRIEVERPVELLVVAGMTSEIRPELDNDFWLRIVQFRSSDRAGMRYRGAFFANQVERKVKRLNLEAVGAMFHITTMGQWGSEMVPYFRWEHVAPGYGTHVALRTDGGRWVQEHRPTGTTVPVFDPRDIDLFSADAWNPGNSQRFQPDQQLSRHSPGLIIEPDLRIVYAPYDPDDVPEMIRASWGDSPLARDDQFMQGISTQ